MDGITVSSIENKKIQRLIQLKNLKQNEWHGI